MHALPAIEHHAPGTICWLDLASPDPERVKPFYTSLFGWGFVDSPMGTEGVYTTWTLHGLEHAAMYQAPPDMPTHWGLYVCVQDADATTADAENAGGTVLMPPTDVADYGRMALLRDPQGAVISIWQPRTHIGARILNKVGTLCWSELLTSDPADATRFYRQVFGWKADTRSAGPPAKQMDYTEWICDGAHIAGMLEIQEEWGPVPPVWVPYFQVIDCIETAEKAKKLGGKIEMGPMPIEGVGTFAMLSDPLGAHFCVLEESLVA